MLVGIVQLFFKSLILNLKLPSFKLPTTNELLAILSFQKPQLRLRDLASDTVDAVAG